MAIAGIGATRHSTIGARLSSGAEAFSHVANTNARAVARAGLEVAAFTGPSHVAIALAVIHASTVTRATKRASELSAINAGKVLITNTCSLVTGSLSRAVVDAWGNLASNTTISILAQTSSIMAGSVVAA